MEKLASDARPASATPNGMARMMLRLLTVDQPGIVCGVVIVVTAASGRASSCSVGQGSLHPLHR